MDMLKMMDWINDARFLQFQGKEASKKRSVATGSLWDENMEKKKMDKVTVQIQGYEIDFDSAKEMARILAERDNEMTTLVSWNDAQRNIHSPQCLQCEIKGDPGWEVYGRNHEGRLRISFNNDIFVFIYT